uniref:Uncharacterized protein n=1 Tax=Arundo donax TaxID=35708 RepID=A0A0A8YI30_ARUDO
MKIYYSVCLYCGQLLLVKWKIYWEVNKLLGVDCCLNDSRAREVIMLKFIS